MPIEYHKLFGVSSVANLEALASQRAQALARAVIQHEDCTLVDLLVTSDVDRPQADVIVIDLACHGLPNRNRVGILPRERLALVVPGDPSLLVEVLALRMGFPVLIHQNDGNRAGAPSLCLYFEPPEAVHRTWTPQMFIRRIQWWLVESSKDAIHLADQPVESLFFKSKFELVLPQEFSILTRRHDARLVVTQGDERPDGGKTFFLREALGGSPNQPGSAALINCLMPPVVNGLVERDPQTLGELVDVLTGRGVDVLQHLRQVVEADIGEAGVPVSNEENLVVLFLTIPIVRAEGGETERFTHRAFLLLGGRGKLGVAIGALHVQHNRYFRVVLIGEANRPPNEEWREQFVWPMDVLLMNDAEAARKQSSLGSAGPAGVLVGAGALGSALANLWGRSGWGEWTVIDNDHVKPHNLVRHTAFSSHIGWPKPDVISALHQAAVGTATKMAGLVADALKFDRNGVLETLQRGQIIVDATAAIEFPRLASQTEQIGRTISTFVSPNGNDAVLMAEDEGRAVRLRTIEAQYYREIIRNDWGRHHLDSDLPKYWSGRGCRDISVALPYSRVLAHASTLAEQVIEAISRREATLHVWQRNPRNASVTCVDIPVQGEQSVQLNELTAFYDAGLLAHLTRLRNENLPRETGGVLLGYFDFNVKAVVIVDALAAPPDSFGSVASFERGVVGLKDVVDEASRRTAGIVGYIGEWHSHPPGHSSAASRDDLIQLVGIALQMHEDGLPALQLIVGEGGIQILMATAG